MHDKIQSEQHSVGQSILLHLMPGLLITAGYFALIGPLQRAGYPSIMALTVAAIFLLIPVQLGYLLVQGKRLNGRYSLQGVISYRWPLPFKQYLLWVPELFVAAGLIFTLFKTGQPVPAGKGLCSLADLAKWSGGRVCQRPIDRDLCAACDLCDCDWANGGGVVFPRVLAAAHGLCRASGRPCCTVSCLPCIISSRHG